MKGKIFNAQEVQAIIAGNKTMFRELINWHKDSSNARCPYQVGQKIFCKERLFNDGDQFFYDDEDGTILDKKDEKFWKRNCSKRVISARNCPQWASRLTLQIKSVGVERLGDISEEDAVKEGIMNSGGFMDEKGVVTLRSDIDGFRDYWNATHKKLEEKFEASPWVWCFEYEVVR